MVELWYFEMVNHRYVCGRSVTKTYNVPHIMSHNSLSSLDDIQNARAILLISLYHGQTVIPELANCFSVKEKNNTVICLTVHRKCTFWPE